MAISLNGGKGNHAPYEITHIRVPLPLKFQLEQLISSFKYIVRSQDRAALGNFLTKLIEFVDTLPPQCDQLRLELKLRERAETAISELALKSSAETIAALQQERDLLKEKSRSAIALLEDALKLRANSGGAIKEKIKEALILIDDQKG